MTVKLYIGGKMSTIDEDDLVHLEQEMTSLQIWDGYICIKTKNKKEPLHRFLLKKQGINLDGLVVHHKDGNGLNNCKSNLEAVTVQENALGKKGSSKTSKFKGVRLTKTKYGSRWKAEIRPNNKSIFLGTYLSEEDAAVAYDLASVKLFGEKLSILNFPDKNWSSITTLEDWKKEKALNGRFGVGRVQPSEHDIAEIKRSVSTKEMPKEYRIVSVSQHAKMLGMSRSQYYAHAKLGTFHKPLYLENGRPYFTASMAEDNLKVKASGVGVNGKYVLFYDRHKESD